MASAKRKSKTDKQQKRGRNDGHVVGGGDGDWVVEKSNTGNKLLGKSLTHECISS